MSSALVASFDAMQALRILLKLEEAPDPDTSYLRRLVLADAKRNIAVPAEAPASVDVETAEAASEEAAADEAAEVISEDVPEEDTETAESESESEEAPDDAEVTDAESDDAEDETVAVKTAPKKGSAKA